MAGLLSLLLCRPDGAALLLPRFPLTLIALLLSRAKCSPGAAMVGVEKGQEEVTLGVARPVCSSRSPSHSCSRSSHR